VPASGGGSKVGELTKTGLSVRLYTQTPVSSWFSSMPVMKKENKTEIDILVQILVIGPDINFPKITLRKIQFRMALKIELVALFFVQKPNIGLSKSAGFLNRYMFLFSYFTLSNLFSGSGC
jgi:hypothetical protein